MTIVSPNNYKRCTRCICDTTMPGITFNDKGECNFCTLHDKMDKEFPLGPKGKAILDEKIKKIKASSNGGKYDCVVGISGGRDSMYTLHFVKKILNLNPIAVHFNDGFGNPIAGENMVKGCKKLGVDLRTITSDWRESKKLRIAFLKASVPDLTATTDLGIAAALYSVAAKESIKHVIIGQSFRTEGICPLSWNFLDGKYLKGIYKTMEGAKLRKWKPEDPGFNLGVRELFYYSVVKGIKTVPVLYYHDYVRKNVDQFLEEELGWTNPGAHYFDDLYQALISYILRVKFNINRRLFNYSALVRSGQMDREEAIQKSKADYSIEAPENVELCLKRLGLSKEEFEEILQLPTKTFRDYPNSYSTIKFFKYPIKIASKMSILPGSAYDKYFNCGV